MTTLARYDGTAFTISGSAIVLAPFASVEVKREDSGALVSLFSDRAGTVGISNAMTADAYGRFYFYSAATTDGLRIRVTEAGSPGLEYTLRNQKCGSMGELDWNTLTLAMLACGDADALLQVLLADLVSDVDIEGVPVAGDYLFLGDVSEGKVNAMLAQNIFRVLSGMTRINSSSLTRIPVYDAGSPDAVGYLAGDDLALPRSYLAGGTLSNTTFGSPNDIVNDIDVAAGAARDSTNTVNIVWAALNAKRLDAIFSAGSLGGMLDSDPSPPGLTTGTYHIFAIRKDSDGTGDILASTSATAPVMPSGYTYFRRIGALRRESSAIVPFKQEGDRFERNTLFNESTVNWAAFDTTPRNFTCAVPSGIKVLAMLQVFVSRSTGTEGAFIYRTDQTDETPDPQNNAIGQVGITVSATGIAAGRIVEPVQVMTDTNGQVRARIAIGASAFDVRSRGWIDRRGRDD